AALAGAPGRERPGRDREDMIPVAEGARLVDDDQAVAVAVEREPDGPGPGADARLELLRVKGSDVAVDGRPARPHAERGHLRSERVEQARSDTVRRPVGTVEHELQTREIEARREARPKPVEIPARGAPDRAEPAHPGARGARPPPAALPPP